VNGEACGQGWGGRPGAADRGLDTKPCFHWNIIIFNDKVSCRHDRILGRW